ncbi:MAG TPA: hypothetical protein VKY26_11475, partial [Actinomycetota bacterium]|nr:hypothetical protein [Actinomycetota bacterium]
PTNGRVTRILAGAGTVSYGLYLWHGVVVTAAVDHPTLVPLHHPGVLGYVVHLGLLLGVSLALAIASWRLLEKPIIDWARGSSVNRLRGRHEPQEAMDVPVTASVGSLPPPAVALGLNQSTSQLGQPL